jgi:hypothetical protein
MTPNSASSIRLEPTSLSASHKRVVDEICALNWIGLGAEDLTAVAWAYYYFSVQFRESLDAALRLYPNDESFLELAEGECDTDNLSPWPGVVTSGEKVNHDEFMRRALELSPISVTDKSNVQTIGTGYLARTRTMDDMTLAMSLATYEDGGLEAVFKAFITAPVWSTPLLAAFRHFLDRHITFDSDPDHGHGALCRHLVCDDRVVTLWEEFRDLLVAAAPALRHDASQDAARGVAIRSAA